MTAAAEETAPESAGPEAPEEPLPGQGTEDGAKLQAAHDAFTAGDYRRVRELTTALAAAADPDVARAAAALRRRTEVDPAQLVVLGGCLLFFLFVVWKYVLG